MVTIGIDVGLTGAIAAIDQDEQLIGVEDLEVMVHGKVKWIDAQDLLGTIRLMREGRPARAIVEQTQVMPKLGLQAAMSKGMTTGSVLAALQIAGVSIELVQPAVWKRAHGLVAPKASDAEKKTASLTKARMLFPTAELELGKHHNRAEALLIAHWAVRRKWSKAA